MQRASQLGAAREAEERAEVALRPRPSMRQVWYPLDDPKASQAGRRRIAAAVDKTKLLLARGRDSDSVSALPVLPPTMGDPSSDELLERAAERANIAHTIFMMLDTDADGVVAVDQVRATLPSCPTPFLGSCSHKT